MPTIAELAEIIGQEPHTSIFGSEVLITAALISIATDKEQADELKEKAEKLSQDIKNNPDLYLEVSVGLANTILAVLAIDFRFTEQ